MNTANKRFVGRTMAVLASLAVLAACGCQSVQNPIQSITPNAPAGKIDNTPAIVDEATQIRAWPQTAAYYPNSDTDAGNIGFWWEPKQGICQYESGLIETPLFFVNVCILPISLAIVPPWHPVRWGTGTVPPTYSANPPLPPTKAGPAIAGEGLTPGPTTLK